MPAPRSQWADVAPGDRRPQGKARLAAAARQQRRAARLANGESGEAPGLKASQIRSADRGHLCRRRRTGVAVAGIAAESRADRRGTEARRRIHRFDCRRQRRIGAVLVRSRWLARRRSRAAGGRPSAGREGEKTGGADRVRPARRSPARTGAGRSVGSSAHAGRWRRAARSSSRWPSGPPTRR